MVKKINKVRKQCKKSLKRLANNKGTLNDFNMIKTVIDKHFDLLVNVDQSQNKRQK